MANTYAGAEFVFTGLFLTADGLPLNPVDPATIQCFYFGADGSKFAFVPSGTPMTPTLNSPGRYTYATTIPDNLEANTEVYGVMSALDPNSGVRVAIEQTVTVVLNNAGSGSGIRVAFVKPAGFQ